MNDINQKIIDLLKQKGQLRQEFFYIQNPTIEEEDKYLKALDELDKQIEDWYALVGVKLNG